MRSWPTTIAAAALTVSLPVSLAACGGDDEEPSVGDTPPASGSPTPGETPVEPPTPTDSPTQSPPEDSPTVVTIAIKGDRITPGGDRIEVDRGEPVTLEITSDRAGELHVHSKPEQYVEFEAGSSTHKLLIDAPGVVDVEDHETGHVIVQLEVQ